jgi:hypothetical protein
MAKTSSFLIIFSFSPFFFRLLFITTNGSGGVANHTIQRSAIPDSINNLPLECPFVPQSLLEFSTGLTLW